MQRAALIGWIVRAVVMTIAAMIGVMMVNVVCCAWIGEIDSNIALKLNDVLQMGANQRHDCGDLRKKKQAQKPRADAPPCQPQHHFMNGPASFY